MDKKDWTFAEIDELYRRFNPDALDGGGKTVVVAEDSAPMRSVICAALKSKGFKAIPAENGLQALKKVRDSMPDCCLLDLNLPKVSGFDILEALKKDPRYSAIPILVCSARKEKRDIIMASKYGAAGYVTKPFEMEELLKRISDLCLDV